MFTDEERDWFSSSGVKREEFVMKEWRRTRVGFDGLNGVGEVW